jgi:phosphoglycerate dehydrogenase-like enzyme
MPVEALPDARKLSLFLFPGAGLLTPDPEAFPAGCPVVNVFEHDAPVAEYVLMVMLLHTTGLGGYLESFRAGRWDGSGRVGGMPHGELAGRTAGLFGYGRIGQAVAARARAFGMRIAAVSGGPIATHLPQPDFAGGPDELPELLRQSDFLVIAAPLTPATEGRIGTRELELLPPGAMLVNVSRAPIVDERSLYEALAGGRLAGAALDVWYRYPPPGECGHGSVFPFHTLPNVICTPHYSAWSRAMILRRIERMTENLKRLARGEELERVVLVGTWRP